MREILVLRHGESEWNRERRWQGWTDIALTEAGEEQARARGRALATAAIAPVAIRSSDLQRAHRTAVLIAAELGGPEPVTDEGFRERHGGVFQGLTSDEIRERFPDDLAAWRAKRIEELPGGESTPVLLARFDAALARADAGSPPGTLLVVAHGGVLRSVLERAGIEGRIFPNLGGMWLEFDPESGTIAAGALLEPLPAHEIDVE